MTKAEKRRERDERIVEALRSGKRHREIALDMGMTRQRVGQIARAHGLGLRVLPNRINSDEAMALYRADRTDREIASHLGVSANAVWYWRVRRGLPVNSRRATKEMHQRAVSLVQNGKSYGEAAKEAGISRSAVAGAVMRWKQRQQVAA